MQELLSIFDRLQGVFGRGYLVAGVIPMLVAAGVVVGIGFVEVPGIREAVLWTTTLSGWQLTAMTAALVFGLAVVGFAYWMLNPWLRGVLEARVPVVGKALRRELLERQLRTYADLDAAVERARGEMAEYRVKAPLDVAHARQGAAWAATWPALLEGAVAVGNSKAGVSSDIGAATQKLLDTVTAARKDRKPVRASDFGALVAALAADRSAGKDASPRLLDAVFAVNTSLMPYARRVAELAFLGELTKRNDRFPYERAAIAATRLGNLAQIQREYGVLRYGVDFDLFGPHFLKLAAADDKFGPLVDDAKLKLDFAVAMTVMFGAVTVGLLVTSAIAGVRVVPILLVAVTGVLLTAAFLETAVTAQRGMTAVTRAVVDLYRFDVLKALHIGLPNTDADERATWEGVVGRAQHTTTMAVAYVNT